ncbi:unnamed protein product, partial [Meganyctiphanes norvegica]
MLRGFGRGVGDMLAFRTLTFFTGNAPVYFWCKKFENRTKNNLSVIFGLLPIKTPKFLGHGKFKPKITLQFLTDIHIFYTKTIRSALHIQKNIKNIGGKRFLSRVKKK